MMFSRLDKRRLRERYEPLPGRVYDQAEDLQRCLAEQVPVFGPEHHHARPVLALDHHADRSHVVLDNSPVYELVTVILPVLHMQGLEQPKLVAWNDTPRYRPVPPAVPQDRRRQDGPLRWLYGLLSISLRSGSSCVDLEVLYLPSKPSHPFNPLTIRQHMFSGHYTPARLRTAAWDAFQGVRILFVQYQRVVVKAGTGVLTGASGADLDIDVLRDLARQLCRLRKASCEVPARYLGRHRRRPGRIGRRADQERGVQSRQVLAAIGQSRLMQTYQELFASHGVQVAQALLTIADLSNRKSYLNVRNTLQGLLELGVVPVLNENDVVAVDEIGEVFGDNDRLSALTANLVDADLLLVLHRHRRTLHRRSPHRPIRDADRAG